MFHEGDGGIGMCELTAVLERTLRSLSRDYTRVTPGLYTPPEPSIWHG